MVKVTVLLTHLQYKAIAHAAMTMLWAVVGIFWALICLENSTAVSCYMMFLWELWQPTADCLKSSPPCGHEFVSVRKLLGTDTSGLCLLFLGVSPGAASHLHTGSISGWQEIMTAVPGIKCRQELLF